MIVLITGMLLFFVFSKMQISDFCDVLQYLTLKYFLLLLGLTILEAILYSNRYILFFDIKYNLSAFFGYLAGFVFGRVVPPRPFGEYLRLLLTMHYFKTKFKESLLAIIFDNLIDMLGLGFYGILASLILSTNFIFLEILLLILVLMSCIYIFYIFYKTFVSIQNIFGIKQIYNLLLYLKETVLKQIYIFMSMKKSNIIIGIIITLVNYLVAFFKMYLILVMLGFNLPFITVASIWCVAHIAGSASMLPGGLGVFELTFMYLARLHGVPESLGLAAALIERIFNVWLMSIVGFAYFIITKIPLQNLQDQFYIFVVNIVNKLYTKIIPDDKNKKKRNTN